MALKLMYITNNVEIAKIAEQSDVDWIFIDLEINGKVERQGHLDTVISRHKMEDIIEIKKVITKSKLMVRVNPIFADSKDEIETVIQYGADNVMLPFFKTVNEVEEFIKIVNGKAKTILLLETPEAVEIIDDILSVKGIDYIHIGLNDLHLGYGMKFMFELLANGKVEEICARIKMKNIPFGFGGIAQIGKGFLPAEKIIAEHYRLGSSMVILSRSFYNFGNGKDINNASVVFKDGISKIRNYESSLRFEEKDFFTNNKNEIITIVNSITKS